MLPFYILICIALLLLLMLSLHGNILSSMRCHHGNGGYVKSAVEVGNYGSVLIFVVIVFQYFIVSGKNMSQFSITCLLLCQYFVRGNYEAVSMIRNDVGSYNGLTIATHH